MAKQNWIKEAIKTTGALRAQLKIKKDNIIPKDKLETAANAEGKLGKRARLAETLAKLRSKKKEKSST